MFHRPSVYQGTTDYPRLLSGIDFLAGDEGDDMGSILHQATVLLDNAAIKHLPTLGIDIVAAPGATKALIPLTAFFFLDWTANYGGIDADSAALKVGTSGVQLAVLLNDVADGIAQVTGLLAGGADVYNVVGTGGFFSDDWGAFVATLTGIAAADALDRPIQITAQNTLDYTLGHADNTLRVSVAYYILNLETGLFE